MTASAKPFTQTEVDVAPLEPGDRLDQPTFHARYEAAGPGVRAELIRGVVHMPSPVGRVHATEHGLVTTLFGIYALATPGVELGITPTVLLADDAEPQPDLSLRLLNGRTRVVRRGETEYLAGPPELVVEVAYSTASIDLHAKRHDYDVYGVDEYVALLVRTRGVAWFARRDGRLAEVDPEADGILRSRRFPGLWLDPAALLAGDTARLLAVVNQGVASPEHAAFVAALAAPPPPPPSSQQP